MPARFDMPWEEMLRYEGARACPLDFDAYWERALVELNEVEPKVERRLAAFQMPSVTCYDLYFRGVGGARVYAKLLIPKEGSSPCPAVLNFHGYGGKSADWSHYMYQTSLGCVVAAMDCRGQAGLSEENGQYEGSTQQGQIIRGLTGHEDHLLFRKIFLDTVQLAKIVSNLPEVDPSRLATTGGSQGGGLALACAALFPEIKLCAPLYPFLTDYKRVWELDLLQDAYNELKLFFRHSDPQHTSEEEIFRKLSYIDIQFLMPRLRAKVLFAIGLADTICPPSTQMAAFNKITSQKSLEVYHEFGHEALPGHTDKIAQFFLENL